jgi:hypothetical protein
MLKKIEREEDNVVHGHKRPQVTSHRAARTDTPPGYLRTSAALQPPASPSKNNASANKRPCSKGPKTVDDIRSLYHRSCHRLSHTRTMVNKKNERVFPTMYMPSKNYDRLSHRVTTPAYTPAYVPREIPPNSRHHTVLTPAYTPKYSSCSHAACSSGAYTPPPPLVLI